VIYEGRCPPPGAGLPGRRPAAGGGGLPPVHRPRRPHHGAAGRQGPGLALPGATEAHATARRLFYDPLLVSTQVSQSLWLGQDIVTKINGFGDEDCSFFCEFFNNEYQF